MPWSDAAPAIALLTVVVIAGSSLAHSGATIEVIAKDGDDCVASDVCLELFSVPPDLSPGHETSLVLRNHPNSTTSYAAAVTTLDRADPDREATQASSALASTPEVAPGEQAEGGDLIPPEGSDLYLWLTTDDHEAQGGHEVLPVAGEGQVDATRSSPAPGALATLLLALAALGARRAKR